jgi:hypothetical protein
MDPYTHNFEFAVGSSGEQWIKGKCEFDTDGKMTYKITDSSYANGIGFAVNPGA